MDNVSIINTKAVPGRFMDQKPHRPQNFRVAVLSVGDRAAAQRFFARTWGEQRAPDSEQAASEIVRDLENCEFPFPHLAPAPAIGVFNQEEIVGYLGSIPTGFWDGRQEVDAYWIKGFMVEPSYRNGPLGYQLAKMMRDVTGLAGILVVASAARRLFEAVGFRDLGAIPNLVIPINSRRLLELADPDRLGLKSASRLQRMVLRVARGRIAARIGGTLIDLTLSALAGAKRVASRDVEAHVESTPPPKEEIDQLWRRMRESLDFCPTRSGAYIHWRYVGDGSGRYRFVHVRRGAQLVGLVVVRLPERLDDPRLAGLKVALMVDLMVDVRDRSAGTAALLAARRWARLPNCDAALLTLPQLHLRRVARGIGFIRVPGNIHFLIRAPRDTCVVPNTLDNAWVTRGDAWGDDI